MRPSPSSSPAKKPQHLSISTSGRSDTKYRLLQIQTAELDKLKLRLEEANTSYRLTRQEAMRLREARTGHTVERLQQFVRKHQPSKLAEEREFLQHRKGTLEQTLLSLRQSSDGNLAQLESEHMRLIAPKQAEIDGMLPEVMRLEQEVQELRATTREAYSHMDTDIAALQQQYLVLQSRVAAARQQSERLDKILAAAQPSVQRQALDQLQTAAEDLEVRNLDLQAQIASERQQAQAQKAEAEAIIAQLQQQLG